MSPSRVEVIGLKEANRALRRLPVVAQGKVQQVKDVTAFQVSRLASANAPTSQDGSHGHAPGFLRAAIQWASRPRSLSAVVGVQKEAFYWKFLEYGTRFITALGFFRNAADSLRQDHHRRMMQALSKSADQIASEAK